MRCFGRCGFSLNFVKLIYSYFLFNVITVIMIYHCLKANFEMNGLFRDRKEEALVHPYMHCLTMDYGILHSSKGSVFACKIP